MDERDKQRQNADSSNRETRAPDSKVTFVRRTHWEKQCGPIVSTKRGTQIDVSEQPEKAASSILDSFESDSNVTVTNDVLPDKHSRHRATTEEGMQIDESNHDRGNVC
jgi:hypothetical protein